jgi:hypothetical protein
MEIGPQTVSNFPKQEEVKNISIQASVPPRFSVSTVKGPNIMTQAQTVEEVKEHIKKCGFMIRQSIVHVASQTNVNIMFYYCKSKHGDEVLIKVPPNMKVYDGDMAITPMRGGLNLVSDSIKNKYREVHTMLPYAASYAFITNVGIQYFSYHSKDCQSFAFINPEHAKYIFKTRLNFYDCIPSIEFSRLMPANRINTLSMAMASSELRTSQELFIKTISSLSMETLLDAETQFTILIPPRNYVQENSGTIESSKRFIGSHILIGRFEPEILSKDRTVISTRSLTGAEVSILYENGLIKKIRSTILNEDDKSSPRKVNIDITSETLMFKYNGIVYSVSGPLLSGPSDWDIPETNDLNDIVTLFDITTQNMKIKNTAYYQGTVVFEEMITDAALLQKSLEELLSSLYTKLAKEGNSLYKNVDGLQEMFYSRDVPCQNGTCVNDYHDLRVKVLRNNNEFERLSNISRKLASIRVESEKFVQEIMKVKQEVDVDHIVDQVKNYDIEEIDYYAEQEERE